MQNSFITEKLFFSALIFVLISQNECRISGHSKHYDDEPESGLCSVSKVSFTKSSYTYTWEVKGLLPYLDYVEDFEQSLTHEAKDVSFDSSERMNGTWNFKIQALRRSSESQLQTNFYAEYKYFQTEVNQKMNIGMDIQFRLSPDLRTYNISSPAPGFTFSIRKPSRTIVEKAKTKFRRKPPVSISLVTPTEVKVKPKPKKGDEKERTRLGILPANWFSTDPDSSEEKDFFGPNDEDSSDKAENHGIVVMSFDSPNIQPQLVAIRNILKTDAGADATDVQLVFRIFVFYPNEVLPVQSASCRRWDTRITETLPISNEEIQLKPEITLPMPNMPKIENTKTSGECESDAPSFASNLESIFLNQTYSDFTIRVQNHDFPVHRVILAYSSSTLESLLTVNSSSSVLEVTGPHASVSGMEETLRFIYTGKLKSSLTPETAGDTLRLAYKFGIEPLKKLCENFLLSKISMNNVIQLYSLSKDVFSPALAKAAIDFIKRNKQVVISQSEEFHSLTTKYPMLMFELFMSS